MKRYCQLVLLLLATLMFSCKTDKPTDPVTPIIPPVHPDTTQIQHHTGVFILNEGTFTYANASLSYYDSERDSIYNNLFYKVNNIPLGDVAQSLALSGNDLFVVVNNSNYIYKLDASTIEYKSRLDDFYSPREMLVVSDEKAYVTDLIGTSLWIINPQEMTHTGSIEMGMTTEKMVRVGSELYVSNWSKYYVDPEDYNSYTTVQVVDMTTDALTAEIEVGKEPNTMAVDKKGHVWVLCEGRSWDEDYGEQPSLWEIDPATKEATRHLQFEISASCLRADADGNYLYLIGDGDVRCYDVNRQALTDFCIPSEGRLFYNLAVDPDLGIFITDAKNYMMNGSVCRYSYEGVQLGSYDVGINPSAMLFK
jgi:DNA-binding beta-propeller fold protein YncE